MPNDATRRAAGFYADAAKARALATGGSPAAASPALAPDYREEALASAPGEAVSASFGCGDPLAFSHVKPGQAVLDLGCGAGLDLIIAGEKVGAGGRVIGVDASEEMLALASTNISQASLSERIELREGVIEALPIADSSIDWVISNCVVNLSPDKPQVFREIRRVLKPGGAAMIADLVAEDLPEWARAHNDLYSACISGAVSESAYLQLAQESGLRQARIVNRMRYDESMVRGLIADALPIAVDEIAACLGMTRTTLLDMAGRDLSGRISSIKLYAERPLDGPST